MNGYILNFLVYTLAMVGIMLASVVIYKKFMYSKASAHSKNSMRIEEALSLSPKKTLYIVKAENEKFLIAADVERTTLLAKLENNSEELLKKEAEKELQKKVKEDCTVDIDAMRNVIQLRNRTGMQNMSANPVMKNLAGQLKLKRG